MKIRSRAPLRIGLAGGGTDLPAYSNEYGGVVLNATIGMYAYCTIIPTTDNKIKIYAYDNKNTLETDSVPYLPIDDDNTLILHKGIYNRIVKDYNGGKPLSFIMSTSNNINLMALSNKFLNYLRCLVLDSNLIPEFRGIKRLEKLRPS